MAAVIGVLGPLVLAALVAGAAVWGPTLALAGAVALVVLVLAAGWGSLLELPDPGGTAVVVSASGLTAAGTALATADGPRPLAAFAALLALGVLVAFGHELLRAGGRADLVESVTGTLSGQVLAVLAAGWVLVPTTRLGASGVVAAAGAVAAGRIVCAAPLPFAGVWATAAGAAAAAAVVLRLAPDAVGAGVALGSAVAAVVAGLDRMLGPAATAPASVAAAAAAPVAAVGTVAYAVARLLAP